jgi:hypothetical protein
MDARNCALDKAGMKTIPAANNNELTGTRIMFSFWISSAIGKPRAPLSAALLSALSEDNFVLPD